jgi:hypothetical protein
MVSAKVGLQNPITLFHVKVVLAGSCLMSGLAAQSVLQAQNMVVAGIGDIFSGLRTPQRLHDLEYKGGHTRRSR